MKPGNLPFEYPFRWRNEDLASMAGVTEEAAALLEQRDRDLEDFLATLGGGGDAVGGDAFRAEITNAAGNDYAVLASSATGNLKWQWSSGYGKFHTAGASLSADGEDFTLTEGLWIFTVDMGVFPTGADPTSGSFEFSIGSFTTGADISHDEIIGISNPLMSFSQILYLADPAVVNGPSSPFVVNYTNGLDVEVFVQGHFAGAQIAVSSNITTT